MQVEQKVTEHQRVILDIVKDQVDELRQLKPQANDLCNDLELLPESSYTSYSEWMKIIFAIANTSEIYYPIALWFSPEMSR